MSAKLGYPIESSGKESADDVDMNCFYVGPIWVLCFMHCVANCDACFIDGDGIKWSMVKRSRISLTFLVSGFPLYKMGQDGFWSDGGSVFTNRPDTDF